jgi:hypothetical protein
VTDSTVRRATRAAGWLVLACVVAVWCVRSARAFWESPGYDLSALVVGARVLHDGGRAHLYDHNDRYYNIADTPVFEQAAHELGFVGYAPTAFVHPPLLAAMAEPLAAAPFRLTVRAWLVASLAATVAGIWLAFRTWAPRWARPWPLALAFAALAWFEPVRYALWLGQTTPFVFLDLVLALWLVRRKRHVAAGALLSLAVFLKLTPLALVAAWAWQRRTRALAGVGAGLGVLTALSVALTGVGPNLAYARRVAEISGIALVTFNNHSLSALLTRYTFREPDLSTFVMLTPPLWVRATVVAAGVAFVVLAVALTRRRRDAALLDALSILAMLLLPSIAWTHYFVFLLPVALVACTRAPSGTPRVAVAVVSGLLLALCARPWITDQTDFDPLHRGNIAGPSYAALGMLLLVAAIGFWRLRRQSA